VIHQPTHTSTHQRFKAEQKKKHEAKAPVIKESHSQVFELLKTQMTTELGQNAYNFCRLPF
jgi:hypothetical protein